MPQDQILILILAVIAAVVLFQLYNLLGKKVGRQPEDDARAKPATVTNASAPDQTAGRPHVLDAVTLASIAGLKARDPAFDPVRFLEGARQAHETIVRAYASGDRETPRSQNSSTLPALIWSRPRPKRTAPRPRSASWPNCATR
ncbi:MAG: import inner membrane translocase subunit Tim44 [bacterium]|nr:MAG: import inner membrane translocase subunit Tim44 [bacterium]